MNRKSGKKGPLVLAIGVGCIGIYGAYGEADERSPIAMIEKAPDLGHSFPDTADRSPDKIPGNIFTISSSQKQKKNTSNECEHK